MKKYTLIVFVFLLSIVNVFAGENIYSFLDEVVEDKDYVVVVGDAAPGGDSLAAADIVVGIQNYRGGKPLLEAKLASEVSNENKMILVGHPCNNPLIDLSCKEWPYGNGAMFIKIEGDNLIVSGTTDIDVRSVAKIIAQYQVFPYLKDSDILLISDAGIETPKIVPQPREEEVEAEKTAVEETPEETSLEGPGVKPGLEGATPEEDSHTKIEKPATAKEDTFGLEKEKKSFTKKILDWISSLFKKLLG